MAFVGQKMTCDACDRTYSRPEHLRRHLLSHSSKSIHECPQCRKLFKRKDVLGRHTMTCSGVYSPYSPTSADGRACQRCSSKKRKCGHEKPTCTACRRAGHVCIYPVLTSRHPTTSHGACVSTASRDLVTIPPRTSQMLQETCELEPRGIPARHDVPVDIQDNEPPSLTSTHQGLTIDMALQSFLPSLPPTSSFTFLIQYTARYSLQSFVLGMRQLGMQYPLIGSSESISTEACVELSSELFDSLRPTSTIWSSSRDFERNLWHMGKPRQENLICNINLQPEVRPSHQAFMPKLNMTWGIYSGLRRTLLSDWSDVLEERFYDFFSSGSIVSALHLYWIGWHPNCPVIHKPSFNPEKVAYPLLAAMTVIGSCYENLQDARYWFDVVEDLVFNELHSTSKSQQPHYQIQKIQAACLACVYQTWEGDETARTRIRRSRFQELISACRDLDMASIKHDVPTDLKEFDWISFIQVEESIRTLMWVFLLDTSFVIFNNMPPRLGLRELRMGPASCEACFQASSAEECFSILRDWLSHTARPADFSLYRLINMFFNESRSNELLNNLAHESFMNLWCVTSAFHVVLFNLDPLLGGDQQFTRLRVGIDTWEETWTHRLRINDEEFFDPIIATAALKPEAEPTSDSWKRPGFWKNAAEYWLLARVMLDRMLAARESAEAAIQLSGTRGSHLIVNTHLHDGFELATMQHLRSFLLGAAPFI